MGQLGKEDKDLGYCTRHRKCSGQGYMPTLPGEKELLFKYQKFMYSVFIACVQTNYGKAPVRKYTNTFDAQEFYLELEGHAMKSMVFLISTSKLLSYITTERLTRAWTDIMYKFVLYWEEQVQLYHQYIDSGSHFMDDMKKILL